MNNKKILVVEDELTNAILLKRILNKEGYSTVVAHNGFDALQHLEKDTFDAVLTDWMMPQIDGIELIRQMREKMKKLPFIMMVTALVSEGARSYAIESGADDYIAKPIEVEDLLTQLRDGLNKKEQSDKPQQYKVEKKSINVKPPMVGVFIATSTGGPPTLIDLFKDVDTDLDCSYYIVQHGPSWMLETFSQRLQRESGLDVSLATDDLKIRSRHIYLAPGDKHMLISKDYKLKLDDGPKENFVRPAADPLFRSATETFGKYALGVVLTGLGKDGTQGAAQLVSAGAKILVQDPANAIAPSMPTSIVKSGVEHTIISNKDLGKKVSEFAGKLIYELKKA